MHLSLLSCYVSSKWLDAMKPTWAPYCGRRKYCDHNMKIDFGIFPMTFLQTFS